MKMKDFKIKHKFTRSQKMLTKKLKNEIRKNTNFHEKRTNPKSWKFFKKPKNPKELKNFKNLKDVKKTIKFENEKFQEKTKNR